MVKDVMVPVLSSIIFLLFCQPGFGKEFNNQRALENLSSVTVYYDVKTNNPDKLELQLMLIDETYQQLAKAKVKAQFVIGFRSQASNFVTKDEDYVFDDDLATKKKIQEWVRRFKSQGMVIEQCLISASFREIEPEDFLPEIEVIQNSYISMIGYQAKGYSLIIKE